ncbi:MAG: hypothetical protein ACRDA3_06715 [Peptostreptococcaceae bacterium]
MKNKKNKEKKNIENLEYEILGNAFLGSLMDMSGDLDNTGQNFAMYMEADQIRELNRALDKEFHHKDK